MTDKQIINSCEFQSRCIQYKDMYSNKHIKCPIVDFALACRGENKCKYKTVYEQLKAKEQECERLQEGYSELTDIVSPYMDDFTGYNEELGGFDLVLCVKELMEQLDRLKAENDNIKKTFDSLFKVQYKLADNNKKLRQCLTEIKEIACDGYNNGQTSYATLQCEKIINIINEVNNENRK